MGAGRPLGLFEGFGIELEYMIVDQADLSVRPLCDQVLQQIAGVVIDEVEMGALRWSNELVLHVLELKTNGPAARLKGLAAQFQEGVGRVDEVLRPMGARLLPGAMHPWMNPQRETRLWPHANKAIYESYNRIFGCQGHGWSNLQSTHINLPFADDEEFGRLHAAVRLVLPLLPALAASSPIVDGRVTGVLDNRLIFYRDNQKNLPAITGRVIPEPVYSRAAYEQEILGMMYRAIAPFDPQGILQEEWLNSRGAIARFERSAIEIRVLDVQECPLADLAVVSAVVAVLRALVSERWSAWGHQQQLPVGLLAPLFDEALRNGERATVESPEVLACLGLPSAPTSLNELWKHLIGAVEADIPPEYQPALHLILERGPLARRLLTALPEPFSKAQLVSVYRRLADCLARGELFDG